MPRITCLDLAVRSVCHLRLHLGAEQRVLLAEEIDAGDILPADVIHHAVPARRRLASELGDPSGSGIGRQIVEEETGGVDAVHLITLRLCEYDKGFLAGSLKDVPDNRKRAKARAGSLPARRLQLGRRFF